MKNSFTETKKSKTRSAFARATEKGPGTPFDWWLFTIMLTILALNLLGDGLRDALDPKLTD